MSSKAFTQAIAELAILPEDALTQVLAYIETLKHTVPTAVDMKTQSATLDPRHPLRGETYIYRDPFEPAVPTDEWDAVGEVQ